MFQNIPQELQQIGQWLLAGPTDDGKLKRPFTIHGQEPRSSGSTHTWEYLTFELACAWAKHLGWGIGFCFTANDPYCGIDFDIHDVTDRPDNPETWTDQDEIDRILEIAKELDSYAETSVSGKGLHIIVKADTGAGVKTKEVEIYSQGRFLVFTGNVFMNVSIKDHNAKVSGWADRLRSSEVSSGTVESRFNALVEIAENLTDVQVFEHASKINTGPTFLNLWNNLYVTGAGTKYDTASEAELALCNLIGFSCVNKWQALRMFLSSPCAGRAGRGKLNKHRRTNVHAKRSLVRWYEDLEAKNAKTSNFFAGLEAAYINAPVVVDEFDFDALYVGTSEIVEIAQVAYVAPIEQPVIVAPVYETVPSYTFSLDPNTAKTIDWPTGVMGNIACDQIYYRAPRQVKEVAIVATLGLCAAIAGLAYQIKGSGLNLYCIAIGPSAIGKETLFAGTDQIAKAVRLEVPEIDDFIANGEVVSGPAIDSLLSKKPSVAIRFSEFADMLRRMVNTKDSNAQAIKQSITGKFQKSAAFSATGGRLHKSEENNIQGHELGAALTLIGDCTPDKLYSLLTEELKADGFLSRFIFLLCGYERPPENPLLDSIPDDYIDERVKSAVIEMVRNASNAIRDKKCVPIKFSSGAIDLLKRVNIGADERINAAGTYEPERQKWNRFHLMVKKIASLQAVCDGPSNPIVSVEHVQWAVQLMLHTIYVFNKRENEGGIGSDDKARMLFMASLLRDYPTVGKWGVDIELRNRGIIAHSYLRKRCANNNGYSSHMLGVNEMVKKMELEFVMSGYMVPIDKLMLSDDEKAMGVLYYITPAGKNINFNFD